MAKVLNIYFEGKYKAVVTDEYGNFLGEASDYMQTLSLEDPQADNLVRISVDMSDGIVLNWPCLSQDDIDKFLEGCDK